MFRSECSYSISCLYKKRTRDYLTISTSLVSVTALHSVASVNGSDKTVVVGAVNDNTEGQIDNIPRDGKPLISKDVCLCIRHDAWTG